MGDHRHPSQEQRERGKIGGPVNHYERRTHLQENGGTTAITATPRASRHKHQEWQRSATPWPYKQTRRSTTIKEKDRMNVGGSPTIRSVERRLEDRQLLAGSNNKEKHEGRR
jgi:hypothetical protein